MQDESILEPIKMYSSQFKEAHNQNTIEYFEKLVLKSGIDVEEQREAVKRYNIEEAEAESARKQLAKARLVKWLVVFLIVVAFFAALYIFLQTFVNHIYIESKTTSILIASGCLLFNIILTVVTVKKINPWIKRLIQNKDKEEGEAKEWLDKCWALINPLNILFDWNMAAEITKTTTPLINLDKYFDSNKLRYLVNKYGYCNTESEQSSTCFIQSGDLIENPFLILKKFNQDWTTHTYSGSITIHWTTTERGSDGKTRTVHHSQVLTAYVEKPKPYYFYSTELVYFNEAAPDLVFTRDKSGAKGKNEKEIARMVKKGSKDLDKKARDAIKEGKTFTTMNNADFDVLFGADDRNNEIQFRLLFTPLAQKNMVNLIKSQEPFGDDFVFKKDKCMNTIISDHSQSFDYQKDPSYFVHYDYDVVRKRFIEYNNEYFKNLYFDFAPLLSIPLYQMHQSEEAIYGDAYNFGSHYSFYEHEATANDYGALNLKHQSCITDVILKTRVLSKEETADKFIISAHGFEGIPHVDYIQKYGGDGRWHSVPVHWIEYSPVIQESIMQMKSYDTPLHKYKEMHTSGQFDNFINNQTANRSINFKRGIISYLPSQNNLGFDMLNKLLEKQEGEN